MERYVIIGAVASDYSSPGGFTRYHAARYRRG